MNVLRLRAFASALALAVFTLGATPVSPMGTVQKFVDAFNKHDVTGELAACAPQAGIIDDFPPHAWMSCADWESAYEAFNKSDGDTGSHVTLGAPWHVDVTGDVAYVVVPTTYTYEHKGAPVTQNNSVWTLVLKKSSSGWRIAAWAWADGK
ncbi:MAG TPA: nuclear transport factor 2 family protein [Candidatus Baltobacteraceae bacterium]|jgi:ketosteroid isomerase-like protein|nr:nuclear transport factor 2 family protein [Candidatus Baltobacteraceae bacterium]